MSEKPRSIEEYYVTVRHFEQGLHQPPIEANFLDVIVSGKTYKFVSPPGMWQSVMAKLID